MRLACIPGLVVTLCVVVASSKTGYAQAAEQHHESQAVVSLEEAIARAEANEPAFAAALAESRATALERKDAKAALLPSVTYHNQFVFTESNHTQGSTIQGNFSDSLPVFIANNAVHEYYSQGVVNETLGVAQIAAVHLAEANAARAQAELEVARRGLVATVVQLYFNVQGQGSKLIVARRAVSEANHFIEVTQKRESARESAHADVIKARLVQQQREREWEDASLAEEKAKLELGVLLYPDPSTEYRVAEEMIPPPLPDRPTIEAAARENNPEVRSALANLRVGQAEKQSAWSGLLPDLALNYTYGIDAPQFAKHGPDGALNLGYSASATVDVPVWDWLTAERKVKEARLRSEANKAALTSTQRRLLANLAEFYSEAEVARQQLASLDASVIDARDSLRLTNLRYVNGEGTVLDVVDAQNTLVTTENAQIDGMIRYDIALAQLETLTGRL
jgi:outer membrane protein TolC